MKTSLIHLAVAALVLIVAIGAYVLGFHMVSGTKAEATTLAADIAVKEAAQARGAGARARLAEVAADEAFIAEHFVASADIVSFLEGIESSGTPFGADVEVASVAAGAEGKPNTLTLMLSITGSFDAVMRTLGVIEHGRYVVTARDVTWSGSAEGGWTLTGSFIAGARQETP